MTVMADHDRRRLTGSVLQITNAAKLLARACFEQTPPAESWAGLASASSLNATRIWDGNVPFVAVNGAILRTLLAACQHGMGLYELSRSTRPYSVVLATLTRGSIEAFARVNWLLTSPSMEVLVSRQASLEFADLRYPVQQQLSLRVLPAPDKPTVPADQFRVAITRYLSINGLAMERRGLTLIVTDLLAKIYNEGDELYSGLSATAHGQGWATANFFDFTMNDLVLDDQMLIEYCAYVIEVTSEICNLLAAQFSPSSADQDRWASARDLVDTGLRRFLTAKGR